MSRNIPINRYRNIGIIAHIDAGKTTTTERILYYTGKKHKIVEIHDTKDLKSSTTTDYLVQEKERGITIQSAAVTTSWRNHQINIIDTPGHVDFTIEVNRSLRVLDGAVVIFDAVAGVEPQTETNWRLADQYHVPRICYINKMDRTGADYTRTISMIETRLGARPLVCQFPIGMESSFYGMIDIVSNCVYEWDSDDKDSPWSTVGIDEYFSRHPGLKDIVAPNIDKKRINLYEIVLEQDDDAMLAYLDDGTVPSVKELQELIRRGTLSGSFVPVLCGSSFKNKGVQQLLDAIVDYLPSPEDVKSIDLVNGDGLVVGSQICSDDEPFSALAFKIINDPHIGTLTFVRVYSGSVKKNDTLYNTTRNKVEKIGRIVEIHASSSKDILEARAGDIVALVSLSHTETGDTLCDINRRIILERINFPNPVISVAVEPKNRGESDKLNDALGKMVRADPSLQLEIDRETGQIILKGMGELHLEITLSRMDSELSVKANMGKPQVAYKETFTRPFTVTHLLRKQTGGAGQMAKIKVEVKPLPRGWGFVFINKIKGGVIPTEYIPAVEYGFDIQRLTGVLGGYPTEDFQITLIDGEHHAVDSSTFSFEQAARECFREHFSALGGPTLLEPIMKVVIDTPQEYIGGCLGEVGKRRGVPVEQIDRGNYTAIIAEIPLSEMFGFIGSLRTLSSGRATFSMEPSHYAEVPSSIRDEVLAIVN
jgi:elongation factor G